MAEDNDAEKASVEEFRHIFGLLRSERGSINEAQSLIDARMLTDIVRGMVTERIAQFLTREQIESLATRIATDIVENKVRDLLNEPQTLKLIDERLQRITLRADDDHYEETAADMRKVRSWTKSITRLGVALTWSIMVATVTAVVKLLFGINLPLEGGPR